MRTNRIAVHIALLSLFTLFSCNNDVFVKELKTSTTEIQMDGEGDSTTIHANTADWRILSVDDQLNPPGVKFRGKLYDENGKMEGNYDVDFFQINLTKGKLIYTGSQNGFTISRNKDNAIDISVDENLKTDSFKFTVWIGDNYKEIPINITQAPSSGYTFDHITYQYKLSNYHKEWQTTTDSIIVHGDTLRSEISLFTGKHHEFLFSSDNPKAFGYLSAPLTVDIPSGQKDSTIFFGSDKALYQPEAQQGNLPFDNITQKIVLPPGGSQLRVDIAYEYFDTDYTLYLRNNRTGQIKSINGVFHSKMPINTEYFVFVNNKWQR